MVAFYKLDLYNYINNRNNEISKEPCDFSNNIIRIDNMGLPDHIKNKQSRGDLFIRFTQDDEYRLDEDMMIDAIEDFKYHPENEIIPNEILRIDEILGHFT